MPNRDRRPQKGRFQEDDGRRPTQAEQYQQHSDQYEDDNNYARQNYAPRADQDDNAGLGNPYDRHDAQYRGGGYSQQSRMSEPGEYDPLGDYDRASYASRTSQAGGTHSSFRGDDFGGGDFTRGGYGGSGTRPSRMSGAASSQSYGRNDERGFFDKAGDQIASWFGDEDTAQRRKTDHRGRGPANYQRSDERLLEDACERLTHDPHVDASNINVTVAEKEVTLDGTVSSRSAKRRAEDCVDNISGVKHVQNNLRVVEDETSWNTSNQERNRAEVS